MRIVRTGCSHILAFSNSTLSNFETALPATNENLKKFPPIFIIGPPRSGSTLLYQVLTDYYDVGYLSNIHCRFWGAPSWLERVFHPLKWRKQSDFSSSHGRTNGLTAPSECGAYWYRFFRRYPQYVPLEEADPRKLKQLRRSLAGLIRSFDRPIIFKNLHCGLRLQPIFKAVPEALFIIMKRDLIDNALSLLNGRNSLYNRFDHWWSMEPPAIETLKKLEPHQQVVEQVKQILSLIESDRQEIGRDRFLDIEYDDFCKDVHGNISRINSFFEEHGVQINQRGVEIPLQFLAREVFNLPQELVNNVTDFASKS